MDYFWNIVKFCQENQKGVNFVKNMLFKWRILFKAKSNSKSGDLTVSFSFHLELSASLVGAPDRQHFAGRVVAGLNSHITTHKHKHNERQKQSKTQAQSTHTHTHTRT